MADHYAMLRLLQITDSGFPTGGYAFSHGLEALELAGDVRGERDVRDFALAQIQETLTGIELPAVWHAFQSSDDMEHLSELDELVDCLKPVPIYRQASRKLGRRLLASATPLIDSPCLDSFARAIETGMSPGHHAIVFGVIVHEIGVSGDLALLGFGSSSLNSYIAAAVRLGLIGQGAAQAIIAELQPSLIEAIERAKTLDFSEWGAYSPMIDLAGLAHAGRSARQFSS